MKIQFSGHLHRFMDLPQTAESNKNSLTDIIAELEQLHPGFAGYVIHENGCLRKHVNIFLDDRIVVDREQLSDDLEGVKQIYFMQALSGG